MKKPIIQEQQIIDTLEENYMPYAMSVIISRAIPEIDGLKPSHRKLLYTMYKMGLLNGNLTKSANVVGQTMKLNRFTAAACQIKRKLRTCLLERYGLRRFEIYRGKVKSCMQ